MSGPVVLVTGGAGFIGTWVLRAIRSTEPDARLVVYDVVDNPARWRRILGDEQAAQVRFVAGDLCDRPQLDQTFDDHQVTHVIHLGAWLTPGCQTDPYGGCAANVLGSVALFEAVRARAARIRGLAYASSLAVFGPEADDGAHVGESAPHAATAAAATATVTASGPRGSQPPTFYGAFKKAVEIIARQYWLHYGIASVGLRPHVVYGPERNQGISAGPSLAARAAALGESYRIGFRGRLGYDYVEDVAQAFVRGAFATPAGAFTAELPSQSATPEEIVGLLDRIIPGCAARIDVAGPELPSNVPDHPEPLEHLFPGWQATSLEAGLRKAIEFYR